MTRNEETRGTCSRSNISQIITRLSSFLRRFFLKHERPFDTKKPAVQLRVCRETPLPSSTSSSPSPSQPLPSLASTVILVVVVVVVIDTKEASLSRISFASRYRARSSSNLSRGRTEQKITEIARNYSSSTKSKRQ